MEPDFFEELKFYPRVPKVITSENINNPIRGSTSLFSAPTVLTIAVQGNYKATVIELLKLKPDITYETLVCCNNYDMLNLLLDYDPEAIHYSSILDCESIINSWLACDCFWFFKCLVDYGMPMWALHSKHRDDEKAYISLVKCRIDMCRKSMLTLLWCCNSELFPPKRAFGALKGIIVQMTTQAWVMRGGEGCGARGHLWIKEK